jgi:hypothetical protein
MTPEFSHGTRTRKGRLFARGPGLITKNVYSQSLDPWAGRAIGNVAKEGSLNKLLNECNAPNLEPWENKAGKNVNRKNCTRNQITKLLNMHLSNSQSPCLKRTLEIELYSQLMPRKHTKKPPILDQYSFNLV